MNSMLLKDKAGYFPNWHEVQSKLSLDTKPNKLLEANYCTREDDAWSRRECQSARDGKEETTAAIKIGATCGRWRLSMGNIRLTLGPVPSSWPSSDPTQYTQNSNKIRR